MPLITHIYEVGSTVTATLPFRDSMQLQCHFGTEEEKNQKKKNREKRVTHLSFSSVYMLQNYIPTAHQGFSASTLIINLYLLQEEINISNIASHAPC